MKDLDVVSDSSLPIYVTEDIESRRTENVRDLETA